MYLILTTRVPPRLVESLEEVPDGVPVVAVQREEPPGVQAELRTRLAVKVVAKHLLALATVPESVTKNN